MSHHDQHTQSDFGDPSYGLTRHLGAVDFDKARSSTVEALKGQGFGVLTEIDVKATLKAKLDEDVNPYVILGACNPPLAHQALSAEPDIGLLLPCNVILYEGDGHTPGSEDGTVTVAAIRPTVAMGMVANEALAGIATEVEEKLRRVLASLEEKR